jgi:hypothetical protein
MEGHVWTGRERNEGKRCFAELGWDKERRGSERGWVSRGVEGKGLKERDGKIRKRRRGRAQDIKSPNVADRSTPLDISLE